MAESGVKIEYSDSPTRPGTSSSPERPLWRPSAANQPEVPPDIKVGKFWLQRLASIHPASAQGGQPEPQRAPLWTLVPEPRAPTSPMTPPQSPVYSGSSTPPTPRALTPIPESQRSPRPGPSHSQSPYRPPIVDLLSLSPVSTASMTYEHSGRDEGSTRSNTPVQGRAAESTVTAWGDVADSTVQEHLMQLPKPEFQREIRKLPTSWAQEIKRKRNNYNARCQYAQRKQMYATALQTTEQYAHHLIRQNDAWERAWERSTHELGEVRVENARCTERNADLMREVAELRKQVKGQEDHSNFITRKLSEALHTIGAQSKEIQRLTAENVRLQVVNDQLMANKGVGGESAPARQSVGGE
ncbi:unnamed protein product [Oreochromis niloticus]|nr:unnamed protein product [Mustela putorius furo]